MQVCAGNSTCKKTKEIETKKNAGMVQETVPVKTKETEKKKNAGVCRKQYL